MIPDPCNSANTCRRRAHSSYRTCLDRITPYVLREQLDFFEDELKFVRKLVLAGQKAIDIGANYGVYTLPMASKTWAQGPRMGIRTSVKHRRNS